MRLASLNFFDNRVKTQKEEPDVNFTNILDAGLRILKGDFVLEDLQSIFATLLLTCGVKLIVKILVAVVTCLVGHNFVGETRWHLLG